MDNSEKQIIDVLLVDDDEDEYIIAKDLFTAIGSKYNVHWTGTFDHGMEEIIKEDYDICILDYHLGAQNGIDFINQSVSRNCNTPIILMTGQGDHDVDMMAMKAGAVDYLDKNKLNSDILERAVRYALERKKSEDKIRFLAFYDQLTHLPNRTLFMDRLHNTYALAKRHERMFAVMFLDIDNFKRINDSLGHSVGDMLIKEVAGRLVNCIRKEDTMARDLFVDTLDTVARLGGDEFMILLSEINKPENASKVAERIRQKLLQPVTVEDKVIDVTVSIGITIYPDDGDNIELLIKNADIAMYDAKRVGKNSFHYFNSKMNSTASQKLDLESDLNKALANNELTVYYQPIIDLKTNKIFSMETLIRWQHPDRGILLPSHFILLAEEVGTILKVGEFVMNIAGTDYNKWRREGLPEVNIAINISPKQLNQKDFVKKINHFLEQYNISPGSIIIEITESSIIHDIEKTNTIIDSLRQLGIKIALDDFGTGYSSFTVLKKTNLDILKIDRSFIKNVPEDEEDSTIVYNLISIGHSMNLKIIAEGVERKEQYDFLTEFDCDLAQGFYFAVPVPENEVIKVIKESRLSE